MTVREAGTKDDRPDPMILSMGWPSSRGECFGFGAIGLYP